MLSTSKYMDNLGQTGSIYIWLSSLLSVALGFCKHHDWQKEAELERKEF